jgi:hypothetical protein
MRLRLSWLRDRLLRPQKPQATLVGPWVTRRR